MCFEQKSEEKGRLNRKRVVKNNNLLQRKQPVVNKHKSILEK